MPYINEELKQKVDCDIHNLMISLISIEDEDIEGVLNYTITSLLETLKRGRIQKEGKLCGEILQREWRYKWINRAIGTLECAKLEYYRRLAGPYEDRVAEKNGDISLYL